MAIIKSSLPFEQFLSELFTNDKFFRTDETRALVVPAVNITETDDGYLLEIAAPGLKKEDFKISVENGILTVSAEHKEEEEEKKKNYLRREFNYTTFTRAFELPESVDEDLIEAEYQGGILKIKLGKKEQMREKGPRKINVQ
jgi:HSP20 family protein